MKSQSSLSKFWLFFGVFGISTLTVFAQNDPGVSSQQGETISSPVAPARQRTQARPAPRTRDAEIAHSSDRNCRRSLDQGSVNFTRNIRLAHANIDRLHTAYGDVIAHIAAVQGAVLAQRLSVLKSAAQNAGEAMSRVVAEGLAQDAQLGALSRTLVLGSVYLHEAKNALCESGRTNANGGQDRCDRATQVVARFEEADGLFRSQNEALLQLQDGRSPQFDQVIRVPSDLANAHPEWVAAERRIRQRYQIDGTSVTLADVRFEVDTKGLEAGHLQVMAFDGSGALAGGGELRGLFELNFDAGRLSVPLRRRVLPLASRSKNSTELATVLAPQGNDVTYNELLSARRTSAAAVCSDAQITSYLRAHPSR